MSVAVAAASISTSTSIPTSCTRCTRNTLVAPRRLQTRRTRYGAKSCKRRTRS
jgi:hypothetical protein